MPRLLRLLLGLCPHDNTSFPLSKKRQRVARQVCLDCTMTRPYVLGKGPQGDWERDGEYGIRFRRVRQMWLRLREGK